MPEIEKSNVPFYREGAEAAKEHGEIDLWRQSNRENQRCAMVIDSCINKHNDGMHLDTVAVINEVTAAFGMERTAFVLAAHIADHEWDKRFHTDVMDWAKSEMSKYSTEIQERDSKRFHLSAHSVLIDGVASDVIKMLREIDRDMSDRGSSDISDEIELETPEKLSNKEKVKAITAKLEQGVKDVFESGRFQDYLNVMSKFHNYSFNNTMLIMMQKPEATLVKGFQAWRKDFERNVNKGEKGIQILAPSFFKKEEEQQKRDPVTDEPLYDKDGKPVMETVEVKIPYFKPVFVFDVSQTNGKELPTFGVDELQGEVKDFEKLFQSLREISPFPISFTTLDNGAKGVCCFDSKTIEINDGMSELQTIKTAIHEIAHAMLHDRDLNSPENAPVKDANTREVEAESVAYTVAQYFGLDTSDYSLDYVTAWSSGKELPELKSSLETIQDTASKLINDISAKMLDKEQTKEQTAEKSERSDLIGNTPFKDIPDKQYMRVDTSLTEQIVGKLNEQDIHFSGKINGDKTTFTISKADTDAFRAIEKEVKAAAKEERAKPEKAAEQRSDIIGNTAYKEIPDKKFVKLPSEVVPDITAKMEAAGIQFSGRINGDSTTLTVSKADLRKVNSIIDGKSEPEKAQETATKKPDKDLIIIGNTPFKEIPNKNYIKLTAEKAQAVAEILESQGFKFSGRIDGDKATLTLSKADIPACKKIIAEMHEKEIPPVYRESARYAAEHGESNQFVLSNNLNRVCLTVMKLDAEIAEETGKLGEFTDKLAARYGADRVMYVAAQTINRVDDGRFSPEAKAIAARPEFSGPAEYVCEIKPSVLDSMLTRLYAMQQEKEIAHEKQEYTGKLPDEKITVEDMNAYGYTDNTMLPITTETALEMFDNDTFAVYLLYPDGTEGQAVEREDIEQHSGIFGIETADWERFQTHSERMETVEQTQAAKEAMLLNPNNCMIGIYQIRDDAPDARDIRFESMETLEKSGKQPDRDNYTLVYTCEVLPEDMKDRAALLESVFEKFNTDRPKDFYGHSLSVSDIVVVQNKGDISANYVDRAGFVALESFGRIKESPIKAVEDVVEQNDNSFDGIINNTPPAPTMQEIEEKVKNGEVISLMDMATAIENEKKQPEKASQRPKQSILGRIKQEQAKAKQKPPEQDGKDKTKTKGTVL